MKAKWVRAAFLVLLSIALLLASVGCATDSEPAPDESTADTTPPVISNVGASNASTTGGTIAWNTDEAATSQVEYGTASSYGASSVLDSSLVTNHTVNLPGLAAGTTYHYRVKSKDASDNEAISGDNSFLTPAPSDATAPVVSSVAYTAITTSGATITWTTNEAATSQVQYGSTTAYGSITTLDTNLVASHSVALTGLASGTTYHYRVKSKDAAGNEAASDDKTFDTAQSTPAIGILSHSSFLDSIGYYHVVGEVKNNSSNNRSFVKLTATFYNSANTVVATDFTYTGVDILLPNQKSPFEIIGPDQPISAQVDHYSVTVSDSNITGEEPYRSFTILSQSTNIDGLGYYHVVGEVKNTGSQTVTYVKVVGTFYDSSWKVVAAEFTYTDPSTLVAGQTAPFDVFILSTTLSGKVSSYELQLQV